ncbi:MAG: glycosyltransferase family 4 protein [Pseudomonadota bacterium]|nr:glycosyltransferase family 4 protein [Pseudomonadota bacterium]
MKVVHLVLSKSFGGLELHVDELVKEQNCTINAVIICNKEIASKFSTTEQVITIENFYRFSILSYYNIISILKDLDPDIIHTHGSKTTTVVNIIKWFFSIKHISTIHGKKSNLALYQKSDYVIGVNKNFLQSIKVPHSTIHNWWKPSLPKNLPRANHYILAIGRLEKVKGFDILIKAWKSINKKLIIIGCGKEKKTLHQLVRTYKLDDYISIIPSMSNENLIRYYQNASTLIVSSRREGCQRVVLEALYLKIPVLSTRVGTVDLILPDQFLAPPNNVEALRKLLKKHLCTNEEIDQKKEFQLVKEQYSLTKKCEETINAYKKIYVPKKNTILT